MVQTQAQKQTKLRSGIQPMQIIINTNYLAKRPIPLTSDLFEFPYLTEKPSGLEKYPLISTNVKYDDERMTRLSHPERVQIFFNFSSLIQFVSELTIEDADKINDVLKHNTQFMLEMLFPITFPIIKKMKVASKPEFAMSILYAGEKKVAYQKYNSYLKLDGKMCTVDEIRFTDTFNTNPVYVKLYDLVKDFLTKRDMAIPVLRDDIQKRFDEFLTEFNTNNDDAVLTQITNEINALKTGSTAQNADEKELADEVAQIKTKISEIETQIKEVQNLQEKETDLLQYKSKSLKGAVSSMSAIYKNMFDFSKDKSLNIITDSDVNKLRDDNAYVQNLIDAANKQLTTAKATTTATTAAATTKGKGKGKSYNDDTVENIEILIHGLTTLHEYNEMKGKMLYITTSTDLSQFVKDLQSEQSELKKELSAKNKQVSVIKKKTTIDFSFIVTTSASVLFDNANIAAALDDNSKKPKIKSLSLSLQKMVDEYDIKKELKSLIDEIEISLTKLNTAISYAKTNGKNIEPATIKTMKDEIKSVYDANQPYFSQRTPLSETFMKLRKICGFGYIITTMHQYQDNQLISNEYNLNYNVDADLKKGEYLFHKEIVEAMRLYYFPIRQSMDQDITNIIRVKDSAEINMNKIVDMFENSQSGNKIQSAAIDLVDLQGKPRYECQVQMVVVGGIITEENGSLIDCSYEDYTTGAIILKETYKLNIPQFTDLTQQIANVEKKNEIKYTKKTLKNIVAENAGSMPIAPPAMPIAPPPPPPAIPPPKKTSITMSDTDLESFISSNTPSATGAVSITASQLKDLVKKPEYLKVKEFIETAFNYEKTTPDMNSFVNSNNKITYRKNYSDQKIDADGIINSTIQKKNSELDDNKKNNTLKLDDSNLLTREVAMLTALKTTIDSIDAKLQKQLNLKGGKKTRKRKQKRGKKTRRRQFRYRH
jgi:hypothetical protein